MTRVYDVIVVGAGHAGAEAARAAALLGADVLLITMDLERIAQMSCNPAVGGIAKGQIVREIDALGGFMGIATDRASIQFRMLNRSKGAAMWSPRAQTDRRAFSRLWRRELELTPGLQMYQDTVVGLTTAADGRVTGVTTASGLAFSSRAVILTAGTFLNGLMHTGRVQTPGGRVAEPAAVGLTQQLAALGLRTGRMKTGTPVRIDARSVDFSLTTEQPGDDTSMHFSHLPTVRRELPQLPCHALATNAATHAALREGLPESPLYNGQIQSIGPRYCPSIETKIVTFAERDSHPLYLEPEGVDTTEYYLNGFSSSLPVEVQLRALETIPALRAVEIFRPGYAIEYDYFDPTQLHHSLESKVLPGLWLAGQVNGTTGYEEAAAQGLMAGINAARQLQGLPPVTLARDQAYIGVLIDDLVTKGVDEPYRMFTSRAEFRILLRQDNADERLTPLGVSLGLADEQRARAFEAKMERQRALRSLLRDTLVQPAEINPLIERRGGSATRQPQRAEELLGRPELDLAALIDAVPALQAGVTQMLDPRTAEEELHAVETAIKYAGYIERERMTAERLHRLEAVTLRGKIDYASVKALSTEARQKLARIDPETLGQASRIPGVSPADVNILLLLTRG